VRIVIASSGLGHVARGIEAWAADLGSALADRGEAVTLCKGGGEAEAPFERVIPCWQREATKTQRLLRLLPRRGTWRLGLSSGYGIEQSTFALGLIQHLRRERVDVLHVQDPQVAIITQRAWKLGLVRTRVILAHGTEEPLEYQKKIAYLQHLAPWHLEQARGAGVWKPTWTAIPNFIDIDLFHPGRAPALRDELGIPRDGLVVLTVAAIRRHHKRIDYLIDEFARLREQEPGLPVWLVVAGGWETDTDELVALGRQKLGDRVRFLVRYPRGRMPELYRMADVFVLGSLNEMLGIVLLEAAASALPSLVSRHPVIRWVVGPGGEAIDMEAPGALTESLRAWLSDPARGRSLGEQARQHCLEHFSRDRVVDQILDYYRFVLTHDRPSGSVEEVVTVGQA
jgi:glycosyltransferase involved in cell wall biosynthesis